VNVVDGEERVVVDHLMPIDCLTCSDEAVAARVASVEGLEALVAVGDAVERVAIDLVAGARPGDLLLCHAGIALERLEETT
jgi:hydrogenase maturation factor